MDIDAVYKVAEEAVRIVGARIAKDLKTLTRSTFSLKGPTDLVTEVDLWAEDEIAKLVQQHFPEHLVIGEETSHQLLKTGGASLEAIAADRVCWIVDPVDGTNNFASRLPFVTVSVGIVDRGKRTIGFVYDASRDELFSAVHGHGAFVNGARIRTSDTAELINAIVSTNIPDSREPYAKDYEFLCNEFGKQVRAYRQVGCASLATCWVAAGKLDLYLQYNLRPWDVAAASLIVDEAGGICRNFTHPKEDFSSFHNSFLFCAPNLLPRVDELLTRLPSTHG